MGDKTQLLAMAFATKYKASKVLIGVFLAGLTGLAAWVLIRKSKQEMANNPAVDEFCKVRNFEGQAYD